MKSHPLRQWLRQQTPRKTLKAFASELGLHDITLRRMIAGHDSTSRETFEMVERATGGALKAIDLYKIHQDIRQARERMATAD